LRKALQGVRGFDYLLVDCPPSLGLLTLNALSMVQEVYIPLQTEYLALQGLSLVVRAVDRVRERLNPDLGITGIIGTRYHRRKRLHWEVVETVQRYYKDVLFRTLIKECVALAEAPSHRKTILEYAPHSQGAKDYLSLSWEIMVRSAGRRVAQQLPSI